MDGVELEVRPSRCCHRAQGAEAQDRRARPAFHHRARLIDTMFDLPSLEGVAKVVIDEHNIEEDTKPLLVYAEAKASAA
jgi:ATP-dependent Clp protease ATP-binding subunit ClpX